MKPMAVDEGQVGDKRSVVLLLRYLFVDGKATSVDKMQHLPRAGRLF